MSGGSAPAAPDPYASAQAQTGLNKETAVANANMSHVDQYTPFGSLTYKQIGTNADGTPQYSSSTQLTPQLQQMLDAQMQQDNRLTTTGGLLVDQAGNNINTPINTSGVQTINQGLTNDQYNHWQNQFQHSAGPAAQATAGQATANLANGWDIQKGLQGAGDLQGQFNRAQGAALDQQMGYLKPQQQNTAAQLTDSLRQQGITQESNPAAYQHAMDQQNRDNTFQNQQAFDSSFNTGLASSNQLFNQSLGAGNFANSAQQQGFGQSAWNADALNTNSLQNAQMQTQTAIANAQMQNQQNQFNLGANNDAQNSIMAGYGQNAGMNNAANAQQMQNLFALRNEPLNELSSLRGSTPVQSPQFQNFGLGSGAMNSADLMGAQQAAYQGQLGAYNNKQSGNTALLGTAAMAAAVFF